MNDRNSGKRSRLDLLFVGVGGQGVLTAAKVVGEAAHLAGQRAVVGQLHGMSQRGGSIECPILLGQAESSMVLDTVDVLVAFEPLEGLRALSRVGPRTRVIMNDNAIMPPKSVMAPGDVPTPVQIAERFLFQAGSLIQVHGASVIEEVGEIRTLNVAMLGALSGLEILPFDRDQLWSAVASVYGERYLELNHQAFELGCRQAALAGPDEADGGGAKAAQGRGVSTNG